MFQNFVSEIKHLFLIVPVFIYYLSGILLIFTTISYYISYKYLTYSSLFLIQCLIFDFLLISMIVICIYLNDSYKITTVINVIIEEFNDIKENIDLIKNTYVKSVDEIDKINKSIKNNIIITEKKIEKCLNISVLKKKIKKCFSCFSRSHSSKSFN